MKSKPDNHTADKAALNAQLFDVVRNQDDLRWSFQLDGLIGQGADINARDENGHTLFEYAVEQGNVELATFLLCRGVSWEVQAIETVLSAGLERDRLLVYAVTCRNDIDLVRLLITYGADLNARLKQHRFGPDKTLLMYAAEQGQLDIVKWLLDHSADPHGQDHDGKTALSYARQNPFEHKGSWYYMMLAMCPKTAPSFFDKLLEWRQRKLIFRLLWQSGGLCCERDPEVRRDRSTRRLWRMG